MTGVVEPSEHDATDKKVRIARPSPQRRSPTSSTPKRKLSAAEIYSKPLPLETYPLPAFIPHNPLSLIRVAYTIVSHYLFPPNSHTDICHGYWSEATRSVHVTNVKHIRALWEMGFFGKGNLSRSEPKWLEQERIRVGLSSGETSEQATERRRKERQRLKMERAKSELAIIEEQRGKEAGEVVNSTAAENGVAAQPFSVRAARIAQMANGKPHGPSVSVAEDNVEILDIPEPANQEHLQLSPDEAFFLKYGLGALEISDSSNQPINTHSLFNLCRQNSYFPAILLDQLSPDDPFLVNYVVYHHFRSIGWVVRDGIKFAVDFLLYERGPVFKHAAFAIQIVPSYTDDFWTNSPEKTRTQRRKAGSNWSWFHCVHRVQTSVVKTLVLVYVDIPPPTKVQGDDIGAILRNYRIREFCISRWSPNRSRD